MGIVLEHCNGPPCPRCGCKDCEILQQPAVAGGLHVAGGGTQNLDAWHQGAWWGGGRARCNHCRTTFTFRELPAEPEPIDDVEPSPPEPPAKETTCPACGRSKFYVYSTKGKAQYRKCRDCGHRGEENKTIKKNGAF